MRKIDKATSYANRLYILINEIMAERESLEKKISLLDLEQDDLLHVIELTENVNACEGYLLYKELKLLRQRRRAVKEELQSMVSLSDMLKDTISKNKIRDMIVRLGKRKQRGRTYEPKVRKNLRLVSNS